MAIGIAIIGAGIFATEEHLPAIQACAAFTLKAVYSRSQNAAEDFASTAGKSVDAYFASPTSPSQSLDKLLSRADIPAVTIALPIPIQSSVVRLAMAAGKHVLSEKPIAQDIATATALLATHLSNPNPRIWCVGENFRFREPILFATHIIKKLAAPIVTFSVTLFGYVSADSRFQQTSWRRNPEYHGGILLDGGIHFVAALRLLLHAAGDSITQVAAFTSLLQERLRPVDTASAVLRLRSGKSGTFSISFGTEYKTGFKMQVVTTNGTGKGALSSQTLTEETVQVTSTETKVTLVDTIDEEGGETAPKEKRFNLQSGVRMEVHEFAESVKSGRVDWRASPQEALKDLNVLVAIIESGEEGGDLKSVA